jgi:hypothetical protein
MKRRSSVGRALVRQIKLADLNPPSRNGDFIARASLTNEDLSEVLSRIRSCHYMRWETKSGREI